MLIPTQCATAGFIGVIVSIAIVLESACGPDAAKLI